MSGTSQDFTFIPVELDDESKPRRTKKARSHTARVIRRRLREQDAVALNATSQTSSADSLALPDRPGPEAHRTIVAVDRKTPSPRSLSPVFGALSVDSFAAGTSTSAAEAAHYCLNVDWPNLLTPDEASAWFQMFCKHPVIMHGFCHASATHQDILRGGICSRSTQRDILIHKAETFALLRELVSNASDEDIELILFAVMIMWHYDLHEDEIRDPQISAFRPHMPDANWLCVYGRTQGVEAHARPLKALLDRAGGIRALKLPGLAFAISCGDLIGASIALQKTSLPQYWDTALEVAELCAMLEIPLPMHAGSAFLECSSTFWPDGALAAFTELAGLDQILEAVSSRELGADQRKSLIDSRNAIQHRLLGLPASSTMYPPDRPCLILLVYECCRITAMLYSNSVVFPLPLNTGWHTRLVRQLYDVLNEPGMMDMLQQIPDLLVWCLVIGGIVALGSPDREWFVATLRSIVPASGLMPQSLSTFLWSAKAGEAAAVALWQEVSSPGSPRCVNPLDVVSDSQSIVDSWPRSL